MKEMTYALLRRLLESVPRKSQLRWRIEGDDGQRTMSGCETVGQLLKLDYRGPVYIAGGSGAVLRQGQLGHALQGVCVERTLDGLAVVLDFGDWEQLAND